MKQIKIIVTGLLFGFLLVSCTNKLEGVPEGVFNKDKGPGAIEGDNPIEGEIVDSEPTLDETVEEVVDEVEEKVEEVTENIDKEIKDTQSRIVEVVEPVVEEVKEAPVKIVDTVDKVVESAPVEEVVEEVKEIVESAPEKIEDVSQVVVKAPVETIEEVAKTEPVDQAVEEDVQEEKSLLDRLKEALASWKNKWNNKDNEKVEEVAEEASVEEKVEEVAEEASVEEKAEEVAEEASVEEKVEEVAASNSAENSNNHNQKLNGEVTLVKALADGGVLLFGEFTQFQGQSVPNFIKINEEGKLDQEFVSNLKVGPNGKISSVVEKEDGRLIVGGHFSYIGGKVVNSYVVLTASGSVEPEHTKKVGKGFYGAVSSMAENADGEMVVVGHFTSVDDEAAPSVQLMSNDGEVINESYIEAALEELEMDSEERLSCTSATSRLAALKANRSSYREKRLKLRSERRSSRLEAIKSRIQSRLASRLKGRISRKIASSKNEERSSEEKQLSDDLTKNKKHTYALKRFIKKNKCNSEAAGNEEVNVEESKGRSRRLANIKSRYEEYANRRNASDEDKEDAEAEDKDDDKDEDEDEDDKSNNSWRSRDSERKSDNQRNERNSNSRGGRK